MVRVGYESSISEFINEDENYILGELTKNFTHDLVDQQKYAWIQEINILKKELSSFNGEILFEYKVPRMESVIDNVFLIDGLVFVVEFKVNATEYKKDEQDQVLRYVQQLSSFHYESRDKILIPILVCTEAEDYDNKFNKNDETNIFNTILANKNNICSIISKISEEYKTSSDLSNWSKSRYAPTPSILEAARQLYETHEVGDITEHTSDKTIFEETEKTIDNIIKESKENNRKSILFLTGVPGAGKTLVGLNIATKRSVKNDDHAVFLSGNGPLVNVLREALSRDSYKRNKENNPKTTKQEALNKVYSFIQPVYQFEHDAKDYVGETSENIIIFDEAQRAWTEEKNKNFKVSEPNYLISVMDRKKNWAVIICLVGQGQEINNGEAGISEWFKALNDYYPYWDVYAAEDIKTLCSKYDKININFKKELFLGITQRSVEAPILPQFIEYMLNNDKENAIKVLNNFKDEYPIKISRNLNNAKKFIIKESKQWEINHPDEEVRYGLLAQSNNLRLIPEGIFVKNNINVEAWFLNESEDIRSSNYLEISATEFDIQGLEIDYSIVAWDANLRYINEKFDYYKFRGTKWNKIRKDISKEYLINSYRVLLTRARSGMVIFVPEGNDEDQTRLREYYDGTYEYLKSLGIEEL